MQEAHQRIGLEKCYRIAESNLWLLPYGGTGAPPGRKAPKPRGSGQRRNGMTGLSGALPFPASGETIRTRTRVDHRNSDEAVLVRRIQNKDEIAFKEIVERYQTKVFSIIYGILRNHNDAEDISQQVFTKVYFSIGNFDFRSSLLTWIYKITVNECYDYLRKKRVRKLVYESDFSEEDSVRMENSEPARDLSLIHI